MQQESDTETESEIFPYGDSFKKLLIADVLVRVRTSILTRRDDRANMKKQMEDKLMLEAREAYYCNSFVDYTDPPNKQVTKKHADKALNARLRTYIQAMVDMRHCWLMQTHSDLQRNEASSWTVPKCPACENAETDDQVKISQEQPNLGHHVAEKCHCFKEDRYRITDVESFIHHVKNLAHVCAEHEALMLVMFNTALEVSVHNITKKNSPAVEWMLDTI